MASERVILVTGANQGIGLGLVAALSREGHTVYLSARNESAGKAAIAKLKGEEPNLDIKWVLLDLNDPSTIERAVKTIKDETGRLDVLINNAAVTGLGSPQSCFTVEIPTMRELFETNLFGTILVTQAFLPLIQESHKKHGYGNVVVITSIIGSNTWMAGEATLGWPGVSYKASKAALNSFAIQLAKELQGEGVKVNCVTPPLVATNSTGFNGVSVEEGIKEIIDKCLLGPEDKDKTCKFYGPNGELAW